LSVLLDNFEPCSTGIMLSLYLFFNHHLYGPEFHKLNKSTFEPLFDRAYENVNYKGYAPNEEVRAIRN
jgi:hypothetical protein